MALEFVRNFDLLQSGRGGYTEIERRAAGVCAVDAWTVSSSPSRFHLRGLTIFFVAVAFAQTMTAMARAQTLTNPNPAKPAPAVPSQHGKALKSCPMYGPGFVQVPGSDLCVKVGGSAQGEVTVGR